MGLVVSVLVGRKKSLPRNEEEKGFLETTRGRGGLTKTLGGL